MALLRRSGHAGRVSVHEEPSVENGTKKVSFKLLCTMVRAAVRMKRSAEEFSQALQIREKVQESLGELRRRRIANANAAKAQASSSALPSQKQTNDEDDSAMVRMSERLARESVKSPKEWSKAAGFAQRHVASIETSTSSPATATMKFRMWGGGKNGEVWGGEAVVKRMRKEREGERRRISGVVGGGGDVRGKKRGGVDE